RPNLATRTPGPRSRIFSSHADVFSRHFTHCEVSSGKEGSDMAGYESQQSGDSTEISTMPEAVPQPWLLVAIPGTLLVLLALSMSFIGGLIGAGFVYGAMYLLTHSKQATQYRTPARFRVSKSGIEVDGKNIPKDAIHRVIVRNHVLKAAG